MKKPISISAEVFFGLKDGKVPAKILGEVYRSKSGDSITLDLQWQNEFALDNNLKRLEVLAAIEDMKRTGLLERLSMGVYRINQDYIKSGKISFYI